VAKSGKQRLPGLPARKPDAHKGDFGHVLVIGGSPGMTGAACMAAAAAQRAGAGLVTLALPQGLNLVAEATLWSVMSLPLPEAPGGVLGMEAGDAILRRAGDFSVFALGPGLRRSEETQRMVRMLAAELDAPLVIDADGLNALAGHLDAIDGRRAPTILTPHPGEMSRLLGGLSTAQVQADRMRLAKRFARKHRCVLALKGRGTIVTDGKQACVNETGNPGMATGGMGDVLTGLIAGLLCQGLQPFDAVRLGVFVHGLAGDLAAREMGELALIAEDVLGRVPQVFKAIEDASRAAGSAYLDAQDVVNIVLA
jgi:hydroxyethylthiazole kinase-like uncharacterized protein yjeF